MTLHRSIASKYSLGHHMSSKAVKRKKPMKLQKVCKLRVDLQAIAP